MCLAQPSLAKLLPEVERNKSRYHNPAMCREWETWEYPVRNGLSPSNLSTQHSKNFAQEELERFLRVNGDGRYGRHKENNVFQAQKFWCTRELTEMGAVCTGPNQMGFRHWDQKGTWATIPKQETVTSWQWLAKEKLVFSKKKKKRSYWVDKPHFREVTCLTADSQLKVNSVVF